MWVAWAFRDRGAGRLAASPERRKRTVRYRACGARGWTSLAFHYLMMAALKDINHDLVHHCARSAERRLWGCGREQVLRGRRDLPAWRRRRRRTLHAGFAESALGLSRHAAL